MSVRMVELRCEFGPAGKTEDGYDYIMTVGDYHDGKVNYPLGFRVHKKSDMLKLMRSLLEDFDAAV